MVPETLKLLQKLAQKQDTSGPRDSLKLPQKLDQKQDKRCPRNSVKLLRKENARDLQDSFKLLQKPNPAVYQIFSNYSKIRQRIPVIL